MFQRCQTCPSTCTNFSLPCSRACRPGCGCPPGEVIDEFQNKCVPLAGCSSKLGLQFSPKSCLKFFYQIVDVQLKVKHFRGVNLAL